MVIQVFSDLIGIFLNLIRLSDTAFHNLLGLLLVIVLLRLLPPLYKNISKELESRNEIVDLAETDCCTEFDVFVMALEYYGGPQNQKKIERDFFIYLCNGSDNYVLPYYVRLYLNMRKEA
jgi:hypothetical protein